MTDDDVGDDNSGVAAAAARATTRVGVPKLRPAVVKNVSTKAVSKASSRIGVGRLPVKRLAKLADKTSTVVDFNDNLELGGIAKTYEKKGWRGTLTRVGHGVLSFLRTGFLGIVAWEGYDALVVTGLGGFYPGYTNPPLPLAFGAGAFAGAAHGLTSLVLDSVLSSSAPKPAFPHYRILSHASSHSVLFGVYEFGSRLYERFHGADEPDVPLEHAIVVGTVGGIAGVSSQVVSTFTEHMEHAGVRLKGRPPLPPPRLLVTSAFLPSSLAFLAFEYGKAIYGEEEEYFNSIE